MHTALKRIGPPSVVPLINEYVKVWEGEAKGNSDYYKLRGIQWTLNDEALAGAALAHVNDRLRNANFIPGTREELDALSELRRALSKAIE